MHLATELAKFYLKELQNFGLGNNNIQLFECGNLILKYHLTFAVLTVIKNSGYTILLDCCSFTCYNKTKQFDDLQWEIKQKSRQPLHE